MPQNNTTTAPAPPPGFVPAGSVPPPPGFVPADQIDAQAASTLQPTKKTSFGEDVAQGFGSAAGETLLNLGKLGSYIPCTRYLADKIGDALGNPKIGDGVDPYKAVEAGTAKARQQALDSAGGKVGNGLEGIGEWVNGEELLKGLSVAEKLGIAAKVAKLAESHPALAKLIGIGLNGVRTTALGTAQAAVHGATPGQAATSGLAAAGTGVAFDGAAEGVQAVAPIAKKIAGVEVPVRASQESAGARVAENIASSKSLGRFNVSETQPAAKKVIGSIATQVQNEAAARTGSDVLIDEQALRDVGDGKPYSSLTPDEQGKVLQRIAELKSAPANLPAADDLGDAAENVRSAAKPVFERLDQLTANRALKFSDWQRAEKSAWRRGDFQAAMEAKNAQQKIIDEFSSNFAPNDLSKAKSAWSQAGALDRVDSALSTKAVVGPTPVEFRPKGVIDPGFINGKNLSRQVLKLSNDGTLQSAGLTASHIQALQDLGTLLENGANVRKLNRFVLGGGAALEGLGIVLHPAAAPTAAASAVPVYAVSKLLGRAMTDPEFAANVMKVLRTAGRIATPATAQVSRAILDGTKNSLAQ